MNRTAPKSIPLPCALLALSVAVCLGAASPAHASAFRGGSAAQAEQRESLVHLLDVIQQAAKKLTDRIDGQAAVLQNPGKSEVNNGAAAPLNADSRSKLPVLLLREALLNLPPPGY